MENYMYSLQHIYKSIRIYSHKSIYQLHLLKEYSVKIIVNGNDDPGSNSGRRRLSFS